MSCKWGVGGGVVACVPGHESAGAGEQKQGAGVGVGWQARLGYWA